MHHFLNWREKEDVDDLNELTGRGIQSYRLWLCDDDDLNAVTIRDQLSGFRVFLQWAGSIEAVPETLYTKLMIPRVRRSERSSEQILDADEAQEILEYLARYQYASIEHGYWRSCGRQVCGLVLRTRWTCRTWTLTLKVSPLPTVRIRGHG